MFYFITLRSPVTFLSLSFFMFASFIVTMRETLEAALIVGITLGYVGRTEEKQRAKRFVWAGVGAGIGVSVLGALLFQLLLGGFTGRAEELFEGVVMLVGAALITTVVIWMRKQKQRMDLMKEQLALHVSNGQMWEVFFLVFVAVLREGIETVVFLHAIAVSSGGFHLSGAALGIVAAVVLGYVLFKGSTKLPLKQFFTVTSVLLILFAAGLVAHGIHELQEAGIIPIVIEHVWDVNAILNEKGTIGEFMKGLFGYNGNPSLIEVSSYLAYLLFVFFFLNNRPKTSTLKESS